MRTSRFARTVAVRSSSPYQKRLGPSSFSLPDSLRRGASDQG